MLLHFFFLAQRGYTFSKITFQGVSFVLDLRLCLKKSQCLGFKFCAYTSKYNEVNTSVFCFFKGGFLP